MKYKSCFLAPRSDCSDAQVIISLIHTTWASVPVLLLDHGFLFAFLDHTPEMMEKLKETKKEYFLRIIIIGYEYALLMNIK